MCTSQIFRKKNEVEAELISWNIRSRYLNEHKLKALLEELFGKDFKMQVRYSPLCGPVDS